MGQLEGCEAHDLECPGSNPGAALEGITKQPLHYVREEPLKLSLTHNFSPNLTHTPSP